MALPTVFDLCQPREDVLAGTIAESDFAADLAQVIRGTAPEEYQRPETFFGTTYPTRGLRSLLSNVCRRLSGAGGEVASIFRLDTQFGGGKTHGLIALVHAAGGMRDVPNADEFVDPVLVPAPGTVRIAAFDGENADPTNGRTLEEGLRAYTPWGEIAFALAGRQGFERVRASDEQRVAPGAETIHELFGGQPTLILMDELAVYLRKARLRGARAQMSAFLTALFKAVESAPKAAVVYTLSVGKDGRASDAYTEENQYIADTMAEAESISARKATLLNPTEEDETVQVVRRRLFASIDDAGAQPVIEAYRALWQANRESLAEDALRAATVDAFRAGYPLHPEVLETLTSKTATLANFQRVRGMLRLLARTIADVWKQRPGDAFAIHLHHIDPGNELIRQEIVTRLGQAAYVPAIRYDVAATEGGNRALAQQMDDTQYRGLPPYTSYVTRTIFVHTLAFNDPLKGVKPEHLRFSVLGPGLDISFIEDARKRFIAESAYLDDRQGAPMRFLAEANLNQIVRRQEQDVDPGEVRTQLNDSIREIFKSKTFDQVEVAPGQVSGHRPSTRPERRRVWRSLRRPERTKREDGAGGA
nr:ATP-binding protein [Gemmatimonadota bacterium]